MHIEKYKFGKLFINGDVYIKDTILVPTGIYANWRRKERHKVFLEDVIQHILQKSISHVIIGTGKFGLVEIMIDLKNYLKNENIKLSAKPTAKAVEYYNNIPDKSTIVAAFHLSC